MTDPQSLPRQCTGQLAHFEARITALDQPTDRRRWNGDPMASEEAQYALEAAVEAFRYALKVRGFAIVHSRYGVTATEPSDAF